MPPDQEKTIQESSTSETELEAESEVEPKSEMPPTPDDLSQLQEQVADAYIRFLDGTKGGLFELGAQFGVSLNPMKSFAKDFLLGKGTEIKEEGFFDKIGKNIQNQLVSRVTTQSPLLSYDQSSLNTMQRMIAQSGKKELGDLLAMINGGKDPAKKNDSTLSPENIPNNTSPGTDVPPTTEAILPVATTAAVEYIDKDKRSRVMKTLDMVLDKDRETPIKYRWGGARIGGMDCSGLIYYAIKQAGLVAPGRDSRSLFQKTKTHLIELDENKSIKDTLGTVRRGDLLFRNSTDPSYKRSTGIIPKITKEEKKYRIHHIAFIEKVDYEAGTVDVVESNGSQGVTKNTISVYDRLHNKGKKKSELYVGSVNYNTLPEAKTSEKKMVA